MPPKKGNQSKPERLADEENMEARVSSMENEVAQMRITMESFQEALKREVQENHSILVELLTRNAGKDLEGEDEGSVKRKSVSNRKKHSGVASGMSWLTSLGEMLIDWGRQTMRITTNQGTKLLKRVQNEESLAAQIKELV
ncbi:unnamed protein product [Sphenostylis stenocarpa]|uniref:Uncharacterized protein n=1 Tax=Sphenostylis stenocarpa TaxID=92480 RepID=A0AA86STK1_9FABA|nr:unnamed protein product [Sphenostylis stenocarpa]